MRIGSLASRNSHVDYNNSVPEGLTQTLNVIFCVLRNFVPTPFMIIEELPDTPPGAVTLAILNLNLSHPVRINAVNSPGEEIAFDAFEQSARRAQPLTGSRIEYELWAPSPLSKNAYLGRLHLNAGSPLRLDSPMGGSTVPAGAPLVVGPYRLLFAVFPHARAAQCM